MKPGADSVLAVHGELLLRMAVAVVLGGLIGLERELKNKPAGLRTNVLICLGCALFTDLSLRLAGGGDPGRIAAQVVTGLGFLGAGTILHSGGIVVGLTSAATIWVVAAVGMSVGFGAYQDAVSATALVLVVLFGLGRLEARLDQRTVHTRLLVRLRSATEEATAEVLEQVRRTGLEVTPAARRHGDLDLLALEVVGPRRLHAQALALLARHPAVSTVAASD
jgi:putative Mg2+ transporter-C (MgtC) family protein